MQSGRVAHDHASQCDSRAPTLPAPGRKGYVAKDDQERATYRLRGGDGPQKDVNMREKAAFMEGRKVRGWATLVGRKRPASSPAGDALGIVRAKAGCVQERQLQVQLRSCCRPSPWPPSQLIAIISDAASTGISLQVSFCMAGLEVAELRNHPHPSAAGTPLTWLAHARPTTG